MSITPAIDDKALPDPDDRLVTFIHDAGHRMPGEAGGLFARFFREQAASVVSGPTESPVETLSPTTSR